MKKQILIKPLITEKSQRLSDVEQKYSFVVDKNANKVAIRNAVEKLYGVKVRSVNTSIHPGSRSSQYTRQGLTEGRKPSFKRAIVSLKDGDEIDFFDEV